MSWIYVNNLLDEKYSQVPTTLQELPKNSFPSQEFELRAMLGNWLILAFVPFNSLSWIDKLISKKEYKHAQDNLIKNDCKLRAILSGSEYLSALKRIISVMAENVPQRSYLIDTFIEAN
jgi:hypothetical protein